MNLVYKMSGKRIEHRDNMLSLKLDQISEKIDGRITKMTSRMDDNIQWSKTLIDTIRTEISDIKSENKAIKGTIIKTGIGTAIAIIFGIVGVLGGLVYTISQISTSWLTTLTQILSK